MATCLEAATADELTALVLAAQEGDSDAFGALVEQFENQIVGICYRRTRNHADAEELCQDVFVQALLKIRQLRQPECFGGWLRRIANRLAINRVVRRGPDLTTEPDVLAAEHADLPSPVDHALANERRTQVRSGLDRLKTLDRETLEAHYVHNRSLLEMCDQFDAPLGTIKRRLHVARQRLADELEPCGMA